MRNYLLLILALVGLCGTSGLHAQIVNIESMRVQTDSIRFVLHGDVHYSLRQNNDDHYSALSGNVLTQFKSKSLKDIFMVVGAADFSRLNNNDISGSTLFHLRYNRKLTEHIRFEVFSQVQNNKPLGIRIRQLNGLGPRFKFYSGEQFKCYLGTLYMLENQQFYGNGEKLNTYHRLSSYLSLLFQFGEKRLELSSVSYYQPRLDVWSDFRLSNQTALSIKLSSKLAFSNSLNLYYESKPAVGIANFNYLFTNGLKITL